jgi:tRNA modification GTPase
VSEADLLLLLVDGTVPLSNELQDLVTSLGSHPYLLVVTKADLPQLLDISVFAAPLGVCTVSAKSREGIDQLSSQIYSHFVQSSAFSSEDCAVISNVRHRDVLIRAQQSLASFAENVSHGLPPELLALDIRAALDALGEITGETTTDDLLDLIFSSFCIGK